MKSKLSYIALLAGAALLLNSCMVYEYPMYTSASVGVGSNGWSTSVSWTNARYDVNGFPIYGYYYGQPVYGYTPAGAAIFSIAAITAACLVPDWAPAPWYHGHWHYPHHVHRVSVPKHCPPGHHPGRMPSHAVHRPHAPAVHHAPAAPHRPAVNHKPAAPHRPAVNHKPAAPHRPAVNHKPAAPHQPAVNHKPGVQNRPVSAPAARPQAQRPQMQRPQVSRPQSVSRPAAQRPQMNRPSGGGNHAPRGGHAGGHRR